MCAPCKVIIDQMNQQSAALGDTLGRMLIEGLPVSYEAHDVELFELASCEVDAILAMRKRIKAFAENHATSKEWAELVARLC